MARLVGRGSYEIWADRNTYRTYIRLLRGPQGVAEDYDIELSGAVLRRRSSSFGEGDAQKEDTPVRYDLDLQAPEHSA